MVCGNGTLNVIVPDGCLSHTELDLQCKSPSESVFYEFSLQHRLNPYDAIASVLAYPSDDSVEVSQIVINGKGFKALISGGTLNTKTGIRFLVTTRRNEEREFTVTLPIAPSGIIGTGDNGNYVLGDQGPQGEKGEPGEAGPRGTGWFFGQEDPVPSVNYKERDAFFNNVSRDVFVYNGSNWQKIGNLGGGPTSAGGVGADGKAATVTVGKVTTLPSGQPATVINTGNETDAILDFQLPQGYPGAAGANGQDGKDGVGILSISRGDGQAFLFTLTDGTTHEVSFNQDILDQDQALLTLPNDFILNGNIYTVPADYLTGAKPMPAGLSLNGDLVVTDGSVSYVKSVNNGGLLCAA